MKVKNIFLILLLTLSTLLVSAQSATCDDADPLCAQEGFVFENTSDGSVAEEGIDYDCLGSQPNPAWFFFTIAQEGDLDLLIKQNTSENFDGTGLDVDFICWGPFSDNDYCNSESLNNQNQVGCSFSANYEESFTVNDSEVGDIYVLMVTNYSGEQGWISLEQTNVEDSNAGLTDCSIVFTNDFELCQDTTLDLDVSDESNNVESFTWSFNDGVETTVIQGANSGVLTVPTDIDGDGTVDFLSGTYSCEINQAGDIPVVVDNIVLIDIIKNAGNDNSVSYYEATNNSNVNLTDLLGQHDEGGAWVDVNNSGVDLTDPNNVDLTSLEPGVYVYTYTHENGVNCDPTFATITVTIEPGGGEVEVFQFVTPNGDGNNDVLIIKNIENYSDNNIEIYNRWGVLVYSVEGYGANGEYFRGVSNGRVTIDQSTKLPMGTYYYILKYTNDQGESIDKAGYIYLR